MKWHPKFHRDKGKSLVPPWVAATTWYVLVFAILFVSAVVFVVLWAMRPFVFPDVQPRLEWIIPGIGAAITIAVATVAVVLMQLLFRGPARRISGRCHTCGYDRRGLAADAKCPECGTVPG